MRGFRLITASSKSTTPCSASAPTANSRCKVCPILRTTSTSSGRRKARATSAATITPPRGRPRTKSARMPWSLKWRPSFCPASSRERNTSLICHERPDLFAHDHAAQVVRAEQIEDDNGHFVVHAEREGSRVHYLQSLLEGFEIGDLRIAVGIGVLLGAAVVDTVHPGGWRRRRWLPQAVPTDA